MGILEKCGFFGIHCLDSLTAPMSLLQEHRAYKEITTVQVLNKERDDIQEPNEKGNGFETEQRGDRHRKPSSVCMRLNNGII